MHAYAVGKHGALIIIIAYASMQDSSPCLNNARQICLGYPAFDAPFKPLCMIVQHGMTDMQALVRKAYCNIGLCVNIQQSWGKYWHGRA